MLVTHGKVILFPREILTDARPRSFSVAPENQATGWPVARATGKPVASSKHIRFTDHDVHMVTAHIGHER